MSEDLFVMFLAAGVVLLVFGVILLVVVLFHELQRQKFFKEVANLGYEEGMKREFEFLFGDSVLDRSRDSSRQLVSNFGKEDYQIKYLQKYFGFRINDETLDHLENVCKWNRALDKICQQAPKFEKFKKECYPTFSMHYTSPAGRSSVEETFVFSSENAKKLLSQVEALVLRQQSKKFQRAVMTPQLREAILRRDNWTCQCCGNSIFREPNLLLEVDHIIPVSAGGKTEPSNLQTLCWKCNRSKSDNIQMPFDRNFREDVGNQAVCFPNEINL